MTSDQAYFIQILSDHINGRQSVPQENTDWDAVISYARMHQVSGIIYQQCKSFLPDERKKSLSMQYASEIFFYHNRMHLFDVIRESFSAENIPFLIIKGLEIAKLYPVPALRTMGDCDILVHEEDRIRAANVLTKKGFSLVSKSAREWSLSSSSFEIELHSSLAGNSPLDLPSSQQFSAKVWDYASPVEGSTYYTLDWNYHFIFLLLHIRRHFLSSGIGFRQFADLAVVIKNKLLDWGWIKQELQQIGILQFSITCLSLIVRWFHVEVPIATCDLEDDFIEDATSRILGNGVFGFNDHNNADNVSMQLVIKHGKSKMISRCRRFVALMFPSYEELRYNDKKYPFLDGRAALLPLAWLLRIVYTFRYNGASYLLKKIRSLFISSERLDERKSFLSKWGL